MNDRIRAYEVLAIDSDGEKLGVIKTTEAIEKAKAQELDLILVAANTNPPVAKILDYGKWQYEMQKAATKQRSKGKALDMKGIRLGVRIAEGDLNVRVNHAEKFLKKGHKVRVVLQFKGREMAHFDLAIEKMKEFAKRLDEVSKIEELPKRMGRQLIMILAPDKTIKKPNNPQQNETQE
jgi:translation initiation factor IF-3